MTGAFLLALAAGLIAYGIIVAVTVQRGQRFDPVPREPIAIDAA